MSSRLARCDDKTSLAHRCRRQYSTICKTEAAAHMANHMAINIVGSAFKIRTGSSCCLIKSQTNATPDTIILTIALLAPLPTTLHVLVLEPSACCSSFFTKHVPNQDKIATSTKLTTKVTYSKARRADNAVELPIFVATTMFRMLLAILKIPARAPMAQILTRLSIRRCSQLACIARCDLCCPTSPDFRPPN